MSRAWAVRSNTPRSGRNAAQYLPLGAGWIFSLSGEGGIIKGLGQDVRLTDRFFLGDPQMRGFDIRGVGPRIIREFYTFDENGDPACVGGPPAEGQTCNDVGGYVFFSDPENRQDDPLGGNVYYLGRAELEIPLGTGAREMGLRPSVFLDVGSVFDVNVPQLTDTGPEGVFFPSRNAAGEALYQQVNIASLVNDVCTPAPERCRHHRDQSRQSQSAIVPHLSEQYRAGQRTSGFRETFLGDTYKPRIAIGIGVNWNSPFGPFRIDFAKVLMKQEGDDTKAFTFNVGTQF